jgi:hypothetical protein
MTTKLRLPAISRADPDGEKRRLVLASPQGQRIPGRLPEALGKVNNWGLRSWHSRGPTRHRKGITAGRAGRTPFPFSGRMRDGK